MADCGQVFDNGGTGNLRLIAARKCASSLILPLLCLSLGLSAACKSRAPAGNIGAGSPSSGVPADWLTAPQAPSAIAPPGGARVTAHFHATGAQIYLCKVSPEGAPAWSLKAPDARLFDAAGKEVGSHDAGPSWSTTDGSRVTAKKLAQVDAPRAGAIPWLLLEVTSATGNGPIASATYIQRVGTARGKTPTDGCQGATLGSEVRVDYAADYFFYATGTRPPGPDGAAR